MVYFNRIFVFVVALFLLVNCSSPRMASVANYPGQAESYEDYESADVKIKERIMIYEAYLELTVHEPDSLRNPLLQIAQKYEGYLVRFSPENASLRVKSEYLNQALAEMEQLGKVKDKRISGEDVTDYYLDAQIRLENAEKTRKRFLELLDKAQNVDEILHIEKELARINEQIDLLKGKLQSMDQRAALSLIELNIHRKVKFGPLGYVTYGLYKGITWLFVRN